MKYNTVTMELYNNTISNNGLLLYNPLIEVLNVIVHQEILKLIHFIILYVDGRPFLH